MRVYVSSTFEDLREHRLAAQQILRQLGHEVVGMEDYVAAATRPLTKVLNDVKKCDVYVGLFAWRYGYVPKKGPRLKGAIAGKTSITEYEYRQALSARKPVLAFLVDERAEWPVRHVDREPKKAAAIAALRAELQRDRLVAYFSTPDQLAARVSAAVSTAGLRSEMRRQMITPFKSHIESFTAPEYLSDSHTLPIVEMVSASRPAEAVAVDLSTVWWSTRLFLLAALGENLGRLRRILFTDNEGFIGAASTETIRSALRLVHRQADRWERRVLGLAWVADVAETAQLYIDEWNRIIKADDGDPSAEMAIKVDVTAPNLRQWLGEALQETAVRVESLEGASAVDLLRIIDYPSNFVPVAIPTGKNSEEIRLVAKAELTTKLARSSITELLDRAGAI